MWVRSDIGPVIFNLGTRCVRVSFTLQPLCTRVRLLPGTHRTGRLVSPEADVKFLNKERIPCYKRQSRDDSTAVQTIAWSLVYLTFNVALALEF